MLTGDELKVIDLLAAAANEYQRLPRLHPADWPDFVFHVHALQNIIMSRVAVREHPDVFRGGRS